MIKNIKFNNINKLTINNTAFKIRLAKKNFNGFFERPTQNILSHMTIITSIESIEYLKSSFDISWTISISLTSAAIRLLQIPTYWLLKDVRFEKFLPHFFVKFAKKWSHKIIFNDLNIDLKRNRLNHQKENVFKYYDANLILSWSSQLYLLLNYFRGLNSMSKAGNIYPGFTKDIYGINLALNDTTFLIPIIVFVNNYLLLRISNHPWLINYNMNATNNYSKLIYLSFIMSLFSVFWPKCYAISWISYCITHMVIRKIGDYISQIKYQNKNYSCYVEKNYKKKIEELYNKY